MTDGVILNATDTKEAMVQATNPTAESRKVLQFTDVDMTFKSKGRDVTALKGLNFDIRQNEFVSIVGPSGCGKSTVLRLAAGLADATGGSIEIDGETPDQARRSRRFGFVFQSSVMLHWRTALENVMLPSEVMYEANETRKEFAMQLLQRVGLKGYESLYPRQLSGGMRQRVAIARALSYRPPILLMDEPFGALDALTRRKLHTLLLELSGGADKKTVIFITHDVDEAVLLSDRILIMSGSPGRIEAEIVNDLPRPRTDEMKSMPEYIAMTKEILARLEH